MPTVSTSSSLVNTRVPPQGLKLRDAAAYLGVSEITVRRLVKRGQLKPVRAIRHLLFDRGELDRFLAGVK